MQEIILDLALPDNTEELKHFIYGLLEGIETLKQENALLKQGHGEFNARFYHNSSNNSKPPSTVFFNRKPSFAKPLMENYWLQILSNNNYIYQFAHKKRGKEALTNKISIIENPQNRLVHDGWRNDFNVENVSHTLFGAHLIRELQALFENSENNAWAIEMKKFLLDLNKMGFNQQIKTIKAYEKQDSLICLTEEKAKSQPIKIKGKRAKTKKTLSPNLLERLIKHREPVLTFTSMRVSLLLKSSLKEI